ncbi:hypothetical protein GGH94_000846 [Coemansia aciculifera]|uniref:DSBA-like thioredoxin domain-containing protein n=2 Tax=Coemansia TaxID=4863 RepID=A0A9W8GX08_9FUNG|nr:hypothetical protein GGI19_003796 [Coemansia pectinata]KAJ2867457.1 hypothetical protein GGH94_000846 [Coemansia aciculifera]KAJ2876312.1 hypothetical protein GGH93_000889 [Coemansia aciculifera]KAJ2886800.1 hypothetical protein H4R27_000417 [Coemansia aciculifera]
MSDNATSAYALNISIVLDTICPWCYVGKRRVEKAVALAKQKWPEFEATINYMPYQLDSSMENGLDKHEVYRKKFGDRAAAIHERVALAGKEEGITFSFGGKMSNTLGSHRLIDYARLESSECEEKAVESLLHRYFELEQDIGDEEVLLGAAQDAGLDRAKTKAYLDSDDGIDAVKQKVKHGQKLGITGVPFYIINDRYGISGAETPETFMEAFEKVINCQKEQNCQDSI